MPLRLKINIWKSGRQNLALVKFLELKVWNSSYFPMELMKLNDYLKSFTTQVGSCSKTLDFQGRGFKLQIPVVTQVRNEYLENKCMFCEKGLYERK